MVADLRYAMRALYRTPVFTVAVVLTLGVGIGINTSVFTVLNAVLLAPLPYERSTNVSARLPHLGWCRPWWDG